MKLSIDTSNSEKIIIKVGNSVFTADSKIQKAQALLPLIIDSLAKESASMRDINEIVVNTGPGSFTGIRVGVSVANTLGWALNIPVNGMKVSEKEFTQINYASSE